MINSYVVVAPLIHMHVFFLEISLKPPGGLCAEQSLITIAACGYMEHICLAKASQELSFLLNLVHTFCVRALSFIVTQTQSRLRLMEGGSCSHITGKLTQIWRPSKSGGLDIRQADIGLTGKIEVIPRLIVFSHVLEHNGTIGLRILL